jgi:hypothetical protein
MNTLITLPPSMANLSTVDCAFPSIQGHSQITTSLAYHPFLICSETISMDQYHPCFIGPMTQHSFLGLKTQYSFIGPMTQHEFLGLKTQYSFIGPMTHQGSICPITQILGDMETFVYPSQYRVLNLRHSSLLPTSYGFKYLRIQFMSFLLCTNVAFTLLYNHSSFT